MSERKGGGSGAGERRWGGSRFHLSDLEWSFHHLRAGEERREGAKGEREGGTEREVQRRETASQSREAEVMDSAHRKVTVFP